LTFFDIFQHTRAMICGTIAQVTPEPSMPFCRRMNRPCTCGRLATHDQYGDMIPLEGGEICLTDEEIRGLLTLLTQEWRRRCKVAHDVSVLVQTH